MIRGIEGLGEDLAKMKHNLFTPAFTTLNIGTIQGGTAKNIVPGECSLLLEWRPIPGLAVDYVADVLQALAEDIRIHDPRLRFNIHHLRQQAGFETIENAPLVQALKGATARPVTSIPFGSEASLFAPVAEQTVVFGPGDMRTAHSDRECVPLAELDEAVTVLKGLMTQR